MVTPDPSANEAGAAPGRRSIVDTFTEVVADAGGLVRAEAAMARLETGENLRGLGRQSAKIGAGLILFSVTIVMVAVAGVVALAYLIGMVPALLLVAAVCALLGTWLVRNGLDGMSTQRILPERSLSRMSRDLERLSEQGSPLAPDSIPEGQLNEAP